MYFRRELLFLLLEYLKIALLYVTAILDPKVSLLTDLRKVFGSGVGMVSARASVFIGAREAAQKRLVSVSEKVLRFKRCFPKRISVQDAIFVRGTDFPKILAFTQEDLFTFRDQEKEISEREKEKADEN